MSLESLASRDGMADRDGEEKGILLCGAWTPVWRGREEAHKIPGKRGCRSTTRVVWYAASVVAEHKLAATVFALVRSLDSDCTMDTTFS